jgi:uncharacterized protein (DUF427 family)
MSRWAGMSRSAARTCSPMTLADSNRALRVLETSHPPTIYVPPDDVRVKLLLPSHARSTWCEFKGAARYLGALISNRRFEAVAWTYPHPFAGYEELKEHFAFYPGRVDAAWLDDELVQAQDGDFYGGWITAELASRPLQRRARHIALVSLTRSGQARHPLVDTGNRLHVSVRTPALVSIRAFLPPRRLLSCAACGERTESDVATGGRGSVAGEERDATWHLVQNPLSPPDRPLISLRPKQLAGSLVSPAKVLAVSPARSGHPGSGARRSRLRSMRGRASTGAGSARRVLVRDAESSRASA